MRFRKFRERTLSCGQKSWLGTGLTALGLLLCGTASDASVPSGASSSDDKKEEASSSQDDVSINSFNGSFATKKVDAVIKMADGTPFKIVRTFSSDLVKWDDNLIKDVSTSGVKWGGYRLALSGPLMGGLWSMELGGRLVGDADVLHAPRFGLRRTSTSNSSAYELLENVQRRSQVKPAWVTGDGDTVQFTIASASDSSGNSVAGKKGSTTSGQIEYNETAQGYQYIYYTTSDPTVYYVREIWTSPENYKLYTYSKLKFDTSSLPTSDTNTAVFPLVTNVLAGVVDPRGYTYVLNYTKEAPQDVASIMRDMRVYTTALDAVNLEYPAWSPDGLRVRFILSPRGAPLAQVNFKTDCYGDSGKQGCLSIPANIVFIPNKFPTTTTNTEVAYSASSGAGTSTEVYFEYFQTDANANSPAAVTCQTTSENPLCDSLAIGTMESDLLASIRIVDRDAYETGADDQDAYDAVINYNYEVLGVEGNRNGINEGTTQTTFTTPSGQTAKMYTDYAYINTNSHVLAGVPYYPKGLTSVSYARAHDKDFDDGSSSSGDAHVVESYKYGSFDYQNYAKTQNWVETIDTCVAQYPDDDCGDNSLLTPYPVELARQSLPYWKQYQMTSSWELGRGTTTFGYYDGLAADGITIDSNNVAYLPHAQYPRVVPYYGDLGRRLYRLEKYTHTSYGRLDMPTNYYQEALMYANVATQVVAATSCWTSFGVACAGTAASIALQVVTFYAEDAFDNQILPMTTNQAKLDIVWDLYSTVGSPPEGSSPSTVSGTDMQSAYVFGTDLTTPFWEDYYHNEYDSMPNYTWEEQTMGNMLDAQAVNDYYKENANNPSLYENIADYMQWSKRDPIARQSYLQPQIALKSLTHNGQIRSISYNIDPTSFSPQSVSSNTSTTNGFSCTGTADTYDCSEVILVGGTEGCPTWKLDECGPEYQEVPHTCADIVCDCSKTTVGEDGASHTETESFDLTTQDSATDSASLSSQCNSTMSAMQNAGDKYTYYTNGVSPTISSTELNRKDSGALTVDASNTVHKFAAVLTEPNGTQTMSLYNTTPTAWSYDEGLIHSVQADEFTYGKLLQTQTVIPSVEATGSTEQKRITNYIYKWGNFAKDTYNLKTSNPWVLYLVETKEQVFNKTGLSNASGTLESTPTSTTKQSKYDPFGYEGSIEESNGYLSTKWTTEKTYAHNTSSCTSKALTGSTACDPIRFNLMGLATDEIKSYYNGSSYKSQHTQKQFDTFGREVSQYSKAEQTANQAHGSSTILLKKLTAYYGTNVRQTNSGWANLTQSNTACVYRGTTDDQKVDNIAGMPCWEADAYGSGTVLATYRGGNPSVVHRGQSLHEQQELLRDTVLTGLVTLSGLADDTNAALFEPTTTESETFSYDYGGRLLHHVDNLGRITRQEYRTPEGRLSLIERTAPQRSTVFEYVDRSSDGVSTVRSGNCTVQATTANDYSIVIEKTGYLNGDSDSECLSDADVFSYKQTKTRVDGSKRNVDVRQGYGVDTTKYTSRTYTTFDGSDKRLAENTYRGTNKIRTRQLTQLGRPWQVVETKGGVSGTTKIANEYANGYLTEHTYDRAGYENTRKHAVFGASEIKRLDLQIEDAASGGKQIQTEHTYNNYGLPSLVKQKNLGKTIHSYSYDQHGRRYQTYSYETGANRHQTFFDNDLVKDEFLGTSSSGAPVDNFDRGYRYDRERRIVKATPYGYDGSNAKNAALREFEYDNGLLISSLARRASGHAGYATDPAKVSNDNIIQQTFEYNDDYVRQTAQSVQVLHADGSVKHEIRRAYSYADSEGSPQFVASETVTFRINGGASQAWYTRIFTPDSRDRLQVLTDGSLSVSVTSYDSNTDEPKAETIAPVAYGNMSLNRTYTTDGDVKTITATAYSSASPYSSIGTVSRTYTFNSRGYPDVVNGTLHGQTFTEDYDYDSLGRLNYETIVLAAAAGNLSAVNSKRAYEYNEFGRRSRRTGWYNSSTNTFTDNYVFNSSNSITTNTALTSTPENHLVRVDIDGYLSEADGFQAYAYASSGYISKITRSTGAGTSSAYYDQALLTYDPLGQVVTEQTKRGASSTSITTDKTTTNYNDASGHLAYVINPDGNEWLYGYDGERRVVELETKTASKRKSAVYTPMGLAAVENTAGTSTTVTTYTSNHLGTPLMMASQTNREYAIADAFGQNAYGKHFASNTSYDPASQSGAEYKPLFVEKQQSNGTGLFYFSARYLDPMTGQFVQPDPVAHKNWYVYASNNPTSRIDPDGREDKPKPRLFKSIFEFKASIAKLNFAQANQLPSHQTIYVEGPDSIQAMSVSMAHEQHGVTSSITAYVNGEALKVWTYTKPAGTSGIAYGAEARATGAIGVGGSGGFGIWHTPVEGGAIWDIKPTVYGGGLGGSLGVGACVGKQSGPFSGYFMEGWAALGPVGASVYASPDYESVGACLSVGPGKGGGAEVVDYQMRSDLKE